MIMFGAIAADPALARGGMFTAPEAAQASCPSEEVVWLNFGQMLYFHKGHADYGKGGGAYACLSSARANAYHEAK